MSYYFVMAALFVAWLIWLVLSEISFKRRMKRYDEKTEELYGRSGGS